MVTQSGLPPITSTRWNPDVGVSQNTADVLNMTFYRSLGSADSTTLLASGRSQAWGVMYWPDSSNANVKWFNTGDNIEWIAETSTTNNNSGGNSNNDGAMMLAQGLAAGAALLAAFSF
jgi:hypothetical protein